MVMTSNKRQPPWYGDKHIKVAVNFSKSWYTSILVNFVKVFSLSRKYISSDSMIKNNYFQNSRDCYGRSYTAYVFDTQFSNRVLNVMKLFESHTQLSKVVTNFLLTINVQVHVRNEGCFQGVVLGSTLVSGSQIPSTDSDLNLFPCHSLPFLDVHFSLP